MSIIYTNTINDTTMLSSSACDMILNQSILIKQIQKKYDWDIIVDDTVSTSITELSKLIGSKPVSLRLKVSNNKSNIIASIIWLEGFSYGWDLNLFELLFFYKDSGRSIGEPLGFLTIKDVMKYLNIWVKEKSYDNTSTKKGE